MLKNSNEKLYCFLMKDTCFLDEYMVKSIHILMFLAIMQSQLYVMRLRVI